MLIYQLHAYCDEYEDRFDDIVGSYLHKDSAKEKMAELEEENRRKAEQSRKCNDCPLWAEWSKRSEDMLRATKAYCSDFKRLDSVSGGKCDIGCENDTVHVYDTLYRIEEVEVIE